MKNDIIVICAPSCAGKDTAAKYLAENYGYKFVVSTTTRPIRPGESQKNPYNFVDKETFENIIKNDALIEHRAYSTLVGGEPEIWHYGVEKSEIKDDEKYVCVLDIDGLIEFKKHFDNRITSIFLELDDNIRKERCFQRGDYDESEWNRRLLDDKIKFSKSIIEKEVDFVIDADTDTEEIANDINTIVSLKNQNLDI